MASVAFVPKSCAICGAGFSVRPSRARIARFCSQPCRIAAATRRFADVVAERSRTAQVARRCEHCTRGFSRTAGSLTKDSPGRFCSQDCSRKALAIRRNKSIDRPCENCGTVFHVPGVRVAAARFCSVKCSRPMLAALKTQRGTLTRPCAECRRPFTRRTSVFIAQGRRFCSRRCTEKWQADHSAYIDRRTAVGKYHKRDVARLYWRQRGECVYCRAALNGRYHVDHIIPIARGGTNFVGNIQLLCRGCNVRKHRRLPIVFRRHLGLIGWMTREAA